MSTSTGDLAVKNVQVKIAPEEHERLDSAAKIAGLSLQSYCRRLIQRSLESQPKYIGHESEHEMLEFVLQNDPKAAEWITGNLAMFKEAIQSRILNEKRRKAG